MSATYDRSIVGSKESQLKLRIYAVWAPRFYQGTDATRVRNVCRRIILQHLIFVSAKSEKYVVRITPHTDKVANWHRQSPLLFCF
jgi:hypothetical protein